MRSRIGRWRVFARRMGRGISVEWRETKEIPLLLRQKEFKKAGEQVLDLCKMAGLATIWVIPGGAVITAVIVKMSHRARPSAFRPKPKRNSEELCEECENQSGKHT